MLLSALPLGLVDTAEAAEVSSGQCGDSVTWTLDDQGTLTISGTGKMYDYTYTWEAGKGGTIDTPWFGLREQIRKVVVGKGVTYIGTEAFAGLYNLTSVSLPAGLEGLGNSVFCGCEKLTSVTIPDGVRYAGGNLFLGCHSLKTVSLPDSLQGLGGCTFMECTSLTTVTLPRRLNQVTWHMFYGWQRKPLRGAYPELDRRQGLGQLSDLSCREIPEQLAILPMRLGRRQPNLSRALPARGGRNLHL